VLIPFVKMHAQGNDFVILNGLEQDLPELSYPDLARHLCPRRIAVGADGLVLLLSDSDADARMIIYNSDGSRAEMCGSALRCVASLAAGHFSRDFLDIETDSGTKNARIEPETGVITVNLGSARMLNHAYPVDAFQGDLIDIGNPHYVIWTDDLSQDPHLQYGPGLEHHSAFMNPVNVHFARKISEHEIQMKIWEHACGATLACGTGAASTVFSGIHRALLAHDVTVNVPGGVIRISYLESSDELLLSGTVTKVFEGQFAWKA